ncbi:MAG: hypothetical protein B6U68_02035 [Candidatus Aenigmarchaeota archaeon ex4484_14]|nr:MAG: hypothetical protein B6U68_02035 [Candidatus Aenigmarchaeota archaeon ex4484_14]
MKSQKLDMNQIVQNAKEKKKQEIADLESHSKQLHELVVTENFTVDEVVAESYATFFTPHSEMVIGERSPVYRGGFTSRLVLKVSPDNQDVPVRTLRFNGFSVVRAGDYISAKIPRYEEKRVGSGFHSGPYDNRVFYFDRDFNPEESAIELAILSADGNVLRRDRAVNYKNFVKE